MSHEKPSVYHERQRLQFCLLHSLNNLFQRKDAFTRESLNLIADRLVPDDPDKKSWTPLSLLFKTHHNALTGNYDINVLIAAMEGEGKRVVWHDHRSGAAAIELEDSDDKLMGFVLNVQVRRYAGLWRSRHWVAVRKVDGVWYNLDSDLDVPYAFQNVEEVRKFLDQVMANGGEVLLVLNGDH